MPELKHITHRDRKTGKGFDLIEQENGSVDLMVVNGKNILSHLNLNRKMFEALKIKMQQV